VIACRRLLLISLATLAVTAPACGKKGPPLAPLRPVPAAVENLGARRLGDTVRLEFVLPDRNQDGTRPADLSRVEVYALTIDPTGREPEVREFRERGAIVATIDVRPPPDPDAPPAAEEDTRPAQGATVTAEEHLTPDMRIPVRFEPRSPAGRRLLRMLPMPEPAAGAGREERTYLVLGFSGRDRLSPASARIGVTLRPAPAPPSGLAVTYSETAFALTWTPIAADPWRPLWPALGYSRGFNVYEFAAASDALTTVRPINEAPITDSILDVPLAEFGRPRCFGVRAVESLDNQVVESDLTTPVCVTPVDTFPPAAPTGLEAVSETGSISLIWNANTEKDLAGYLVLRGEAPDATLRPLTAAPIRETTYRDTNVQAGVRYVYAVVAVDTARPANASEPSARVEETAR
jgi:hypothetical protein